MRALGQRRVFERVAGKGNSDAISAFKSSAPNLFDPLEDAMERELTPVEARGGVISGRIFKVLVISSVGAVIVLAGLWALLAVPN